MFPTEFVERIKTHILCIIIFFSENRAAYEIMWRGMVQTDRPQMTILYGARTLHAGWPYRNTLGIIIFMAFPQQQWFRTYIALFLFKDFYAVSVSDIWHTVLFQLMCFAHELWYCWSTTNFNLAVWQWMVGGLQMYNVRQFCPTTVKLL